MPNFKYPNNYDDDFINAFKKVLDYLNDMGYTYEQALNKARDILDEAQQTNDMNESVQQQLNTIIADSGTSPTELAQARIDAEGNEYTVLKERLDEKETQAKEEIALLDNRSEGSLIELLHNYSALSDDVIVRVASQNEIIIGVFYQKNKASIYTMKPDVDGWWRIRDGVLAEMKEIIDTHKSHGKNYETITGSWVTNSPPTHYTTEVGATFSGTFEGVGFNFASRTDNRGGVWEFVVDGNTNNPIRVSTYSESVAVNVVQTVVQGIADGHHTYTATFLGQEDGKSYTEAARGWVNYNDNYPTSSSNMTIEPLFKTYEIIDSHPVLDEGSQIEFAFSVRPNGQSISTEWVPSHGVAGVMRDVSYKIFIDDRELGGLSSELSSVFISAKSIRFITTYNAYHPDDTTGTRLWWGRIDQTFNSKGFNVRGKMSFKKSIRIGTGYPAMLPLRRSVTDNDTVVTSKGQRYSLTTSAIMDDVPSGVVHLTQESSNPKNKNIAVAMEVFDPKRTLRLGEPGTQDIPTRVSVRSDDINKTYMSSHEGHDVQAGEVYSFGTNHFMTEIIDASNILP